MKYISTRGTAPVLPFDAVATSGLASDGGLYVPEHFPSISKETLTAWKSLSYVELAEEVMLPFVESVIPREELRRLIQESYQTFRHPDIAPLKALEDNAYILELFHGPTLAFKDFALQFLGRLLDYLLTKEQRDVVIVGATSGDTGSAAIEGCRHCKHATLFMLHPQGRVSDVQRRQMTTVKADNIYNLALKGTFDDCQDTVKHIFRHPEELGHLSLTAVNSINWARIMAQIVYYFYAALKLGAPEKPVSFSVPTGNFGDIFAGYVAKRMGLPIQQLIVATNQNDILHRFFQDNDYRKTGVTPTISPSMDIQISSNFERLLFELHGRDGVAITQLMDGFQSSGGLKVTGDVLKKARELFDSACVPDEVIKQTIKTLYDTSGYLIDPHTATGVKAASDCRNDVNTPMVVLSTAHPAKFPAVTEEVLGFTPELPEHLADLMEREECMTEVYSPEEVRSFIKNHTA